MSGRVSAAAERALKLIQRGYHPVDAAADTGVHLATVYRMMRRTGVKNGAKDRRRK